MINALLVDDHSATSAGLKLTLEKSGYFQVKKLLNNTDELWESISENQPELIITDISMPGAYIFSTLKEIREKYPDIKLIIYSVHTGEGYFRDASDIGVDGYILKTEKLEHLPIKILEACKGNKYYSKEMQIHLENAPMHFTEKEKQIIRLLLAGKIIDEIAVQLHISKRTVEFHIENIKSKFGVNKMQVLIVELITKYYV